MVAIVTGNGLGIERGSGNVLGQRGQLGSASTGRAGEGVTVNAANGNLILNDRDEVLIGRGPDSIFSRTYNSLGQASDDNGDNWRLNAQRRVLGLNGGYATTGSWIVRVDWDGSETQYVWDAAASAYISREGPGAYDTLTIFNSTITWTDGDSRSVELYDATNGRLVSMADTDGNTVVYTYDASGRLSRVTTANGDWTDLAWSGNNLVSLTTRASDPRTGVAATLTRTRYAYDGSNRLTSVTVDLSPEDGSVADGRTYVTSYSYVGTSKLVSSIVQTDGSRVDFTYDASNRIATFKEWVDATTSRTTTFSYAAGETTITDPAGNATALRFDAYGQLTYLVEPPAEAGAQPRITRYTWDAHFNNTLAEVYDGWGGVSAATPKSRVWHRFEDISGALFDTYEEATGGSIVTRTYHNAQNRVVTSSTYTALDPDGWGGGAAAEAQTTRYIYDAELHLRFTISPEGRVTEFRFDAPGNLVSTIAYTASLYNVGALGESYSYTEQNLIDWLAAIADKSTSIRTDTSYDFRGNVSTVTSYARVDSTGNGILAAGFSRDIHVYDQFGNLLSKQTTDGEPISSQTNILDWGYSWLDRVAVGAAANGDPAYKYTAQVTGNWAAAYAPFTASDGDTITAAITLKGVGSSSGALFGLAGNTSGWGENRYNVARIVSGPGTLTQNSGGQWQIAGLSATEETRIEVTRTFVQGDSGSLHLFPDWPYGARAGQGVIASSPVITRSHDVTETYGYDGLGRTVRFTDAEAVGTWTTYADARNRTIVTLANGLQQASAYNRAGELIAFSESNAGFTGENAVGSLPVYWGYANVTPSSAGMIDGAPALKYTINQAGGWSAAVAAVNATAGDIVTLSVSLQAVGDSTTQWLGLYGNSTAWGSGNNSSARVVSGPGTLSLRNGGLWQINGLSTTEPTRIEIVREYAQTETGGAYIYVDYLQNFRAGAALIISAPSVVNSRSGEAAPGGLFDPAQFDINAWGYANLTKTVSSAMDGASANLYTVQTTGGWAAAYTALNAKAGETYTTAVSLQGTSTGSTASFGLYGNTTGWGYGDDATSVGRIVSGPGTLVQEAGGLWNIIGLVAGQTTRIEITRAYHLDESGGVYLYPDRQGGWIAGHALVAGAVSIVRTPGDLASYKYDALGNLRISIDTAGKRTFLFYDNQRRKIGEVAADGAVSEYRYDARGLVIATVRYAGAYPSGSIAGLYDGYGNPTAVTFAQIKSAIGSNANDRWSWNVYDFAGRLLETIDALGAATVFEYDGSNRVVRTSRYANMIASGTVAGYKTTPPSAPVIPATDAGSDRIVRAFYDKDGNLAGTLDGDSFFTEYLYDKAGRQVETIAYYLRPSQSYWANGTFAQVKSTQATNAYDIHTYTIYDGRGLVVAQINGEGEVTRFEYDARGNVAREIRGQKVSAATAYTLATLPAASGSLAITSYVRDALGQVTSSTEQNSGGNLTVAASYNAMGDLTGATDARGTVTTSYYDARGRLVRVDTPIGNGATATARYEYDSRGNPVKSTDARGNISYNYYDERSRPILAIDAEGYATRTTYNVFGEIASVTRHYNRATGIGSVSTQPAVATDSRDATTTFAYDVRGSVASTTDALGGSEAFQYNAFGDVAVQTNKLGGGTTFLYDRRGFHWITDKGAETFFASAAHEYWVIRTRYERDAFGNVYQQIEAEGQSTRRDTLYFYDRANRLIQKQLPQILVLNEATGAEAAATPAEFYYYDARGNLIKTVDTAGAATFSYYDLLDRKRAEVRQLSAGQAVHTVYDYDANGNLALTRVYEGNATLPGSPGGSAPSTPAGTWRETQFTYDNLDRMTSSSVVSYAGNAISSGLWNGSSYIMWDSGLTSTFQYDAAGNVIKATDAQGGVTWNWYDALGRKTAQLDGENYLTTWSFDAAGNVLVETRFATRYTGTPTTASAPTVGATMDDRLTAYSYDRNGNRLSEIRFSVTAWTVDAATGALGAGSGNSYIGYTYNALGQVVGKTVAGNAVAAYAYDNHGRLSSESRQSFTDVNGATVTPSTEYRYDGLGNLVWSAQRGTGGSYAALDRYTTYSYGQGGLLRASGDAENNNHTYSYDIAGRVIRDSYTRIVNTDTGVGNAATTTVTDAQTKSYDLAGRVTTQGIVSGGARIAFTSYQYNNFDQVIAQGTGSTTASMAAGQTAAYQTQNRYDAAGRLIASNAGDGVWKLYRYDANGNQTAAIASAGDVFNQSTTFAAAQQYAYSSTINATYTVYDKRGMATQVIEEGRDLSAGVTNQTLTTTRAYNAFGEVASETNALGATLTYAYNTMGRLTRRESPAVQITLENGLEIWVKPSEDRYYDLAGRLIASRDANGTYGSSANSQASAYAKAANTGNLTTLALLAGTGYDQTEGLVSTEFHADGGRKQVLYDVMGDARVIRDELYSPSLAWLHVTEQSFNRLGQLTQVKHNRLSNVADDTTRLVDEYRYDQFGQRIQHWNSQFGGYAIEKTAYDALGRVVSQTDLGGYVTTTAYAWDGTLATTGLGTFGGWTETTTYANYRTAISKQDIFEREVFKQDLGSHQFTSSFDAAGRLIASGGQSWTWFNTGLVATAGAPGGYGTKTSTYGYDATGNRSIERVVEGYDTLVDQTATYDALGRLTGMNAAATGVSPAATITEKYDAAGNIRRTVSTHAMLDQAGTAASSVTDDHWFRYDALNRLVTDRGVLSGTAGAAGTTIIRGSTAAYGQVAQGQDYVYDATGQRVAAIRSEHIDGSYYYEYGYYPGSSSEVRESYDYDGAGRVSAIRTSQGAAVEDTYDANYNWVAATTLPPAPTGGTARSTFTYDLMGRQLAQNDFEANGTTVAFSRSANYAANGFLLSDSTSTRRYESGNTNTYVANSTYTATSTTTGEYLLGAVGYVSTYSYKNNYSNTNTASTTNSYVWWDGAVQNTIVYKPNTSNSTTYTTTFYYDAQGVGTSVYIADGRPRTVGFKTNGDGQVIRRDEADNNYNASTGGDPHEVWYRFGGKELGYAGNNGAAARLTEAGSIADRQAVQGTYAFRNGSSYGGAAVDFAQTAGPLNSFAQGSGAGGYVVQRTGETLGSIAQNLWGDASLWYKLAEANGLSADLSLNEGQRLTLPAGVMRSHHNAGTLKPYDPNEALGNVSPTTPKPPKKPKCGAFGQILLVVIAVAVSIIALPAGGPALGWAGVGQGLLAGAAGSVASQAVGVATGIQSKFDFKGVALSAIAGGVGAGLGNLGSLSKGLTGIGKALNGGGFFANAARGALGSAISQGIGVATGLQSKFDFIGVAAAGIGAGVGSALGGALENKGGFFATKFGNDFAYAGASLFANAATRSALSGTNFGNNLIAALPDAIGGVIGRALGGAVSSALRRNDEAIGGGSQAPMGGGGTTNLENGAGLVGASSRGDGPASWHFDAGLGKGRLEAMQDNSVQRIAEIIEAEAPIVVNGQRMTPDQIADYDRRETQRAIGQAYGLTIVVTAPRPRNEDTGAITLRKVDVINMKKVLQSEWVPFAGLDQAKGIVDTILNRVASGHWGGTVADVVNARKQFSDINGPIAWKHGWNSVEEYPGNKITVKVSDFVDFYLKDRASGAPSSVGSHLNYANPYYSDAVNQAWIRKLDGPVLGRGNAIHKHGTVDALQKYRPQPYVIILRQ